MTSPGPFLQAVLFVALAFGATTQNRQMIDATCKTPFTQPTNPTANNTICNPPQIVQVGQFVAGLAVQSGSIKSFACYSMDMFYGIGRWLLQGSNQIPVVSVSSDAFSFAGFYPSVATVNTKPAISFFDTLNGRLGFSRSIDVVGYTWSVVYPDTTANMNVGLYTSMKVLSNSNVGIAYHDNTFEAGGLKYVSSGDANGATWNSPLMLVSGVAVGQYASLYINSANNFPNIAFFDASGNNLWFIAALDVQGSTWGSAVYIGPGGAHAQLIRSGNFPMVIYINLDTNKLFCAVASTTSGSTWNSPFELVDSDANAVVNSVSATILPNGKPAVAYGIISPFMEVHVRFASISNPVANGDWTFCGNSVNQNDCIASFRDTGPTNPYNYVTGVSFFNLIAGTTVASFDSTAGIFMWDSANGYVIGRFVASSSNTSFTTTGAPYRIDGNQYLNTPFSPTYNWTGA